MKPCSVSFLAPLTRIAATVTLLFSGWSLLAAENGPSKTAEPVRPKTHTLYMGADLLISHGGKMYRVRDVSGESFVIDVKGEPTFVSFRGSGVEMKIEESLKLDRRSVSLTDLKSEQIYSAGHDPGLKFAQNVQMVAAAADSLDDAVGRLNGARKIAGADGPNDADYEAFSKAAANSNLDVNNTAYHAKALNDELEKKLYDAISLTFELSSAQPLLHPYVLVTAQLREPEGKREYKNWILAKQLNPIREGAAKIKIVQSGLPPGFAIEKLQVHLYDQGKEIPTTVSPKRIDLTFDDAFQYLLIDYLTTNKGATLPATPGLALLPPDFDARVARSEFKPAYYIKVSKDGTPGDVFLDQRCTEKSNDDYINTVMSKVRFKPALDKGKPVEGIAKVVLGKL